MFVDSSMSTNGGFSYCKLRIQAVIASIEERNQKTKKIKLPRRIRQVEASSSQKRTQQPAKTCAKVLKQYGRRS